MFLTVGQKIKQIRTQYNIKQMDFVEYGFSRNYISMIESNQRKLNQEKLAHLYHGLCELTQHQIKEQYVFENFIKMPKEQAIDWLEENGTIEYGLNHCAEYLAVVNQYDLFTYGHQFEEQLADYYHKKANYSLSYEHALLAISYSVKTSRNPARLYELTGVNLFKLGNYSDAIFQFKLAINCMPDSEDPFIYKVKYDIAISYLYSGHYHEGLEMIEEVMNQDQDLVSKAAAYLIKESMLKKIGHFKEGRDVLHQFIHNCFHQQYLGKAYHNLGCNFMEDGLHEQALEAFENALLHRENEADMLLTKSVLGHLYFELENLSKSEEIFDEISSKIFEIGYTYQKESVLEWGINLYWELEAVEKILILLAKSKQLVRDGKSDHHIVIMVQNQLYKKLMGKALNNPASLPSYRKLLDELAE